MVAVNILLCVANLSIHATAVAAATYRPTTVAAAVAVIVAKPDILVQMEYVCQIKCEKFKFVIFKNDVYSL